MDGPSPLPLLPGDTSVLASNCQSTMTQEQHPVERKEEEEVGIILCTTPSNNIIAILHVLCKVLLFSVLAKRSLTTTPNKRRELITEGG